MYKSIAVLVVSGNDSIHQVISHLQKLKRAWRIWFFNMFHNRDKISTVDGTQVVFYSCSEEHDCDNVQFEFGTECITSIPMRCGIKNNSSGCPGGEPVVDGRILCVFHSVTTFPKSFSIKCMKQNFRQSLKVTMYSVAHIYYTS